MEEASGSISQLTANIESSAKTSASKSDELASATNVREEEHSDFEAAEKELVEANDSLTRAVTIVKREMSFAQGGKGKQ